VSRTQLRSVYLPLKEGRAEGERRLIGKDRGQKAITQLVLTMESLDRIGNCGAGGNYAVIAPRWNREVGSE
jgi:hypothetical protein